MKRLPSLQQIVDTVSPEVTWRRALLVVVFTMNLRIFTFFPGFRLLEEAWFVFSLLAFFCLYTLFKANADWRFSRLELYLLGLIVVLIAVPASSAYTTFGQPLYFGVLARRSSVVITIWLLLIHALKYKWVDARDVERALVFIMWVVVCVFVVMRVFISPSSIPDPPIGFILGFGTEAPAFAAPGYLVPFGTIYYAIRGMREGYLKFYLYAAAIFFAGAGASWRALFLCMSMTLLFYLFRIKRVGEAARMLTQFAVVTAVLITVLNFVKPGVVADTFDHFNAAVQVAVGKEQGNDPSAHARVEEVALAAPYVKAHPFLGAGGLSAQWNAGPSAVLGGYFSDSDIGLLGTVFTYGLVGLIYSSFQYAFAIRSSFGPRAVASGALLDAARGFLLFSALFSITTSFFVVAVENTSFYMVLVVLLSGGTPNRLPEQEQLPQAAALAETAA